MGCGASSKVQPLAVATASPNSHAQQAAIVIQPRSSSGQKHNNPERETKRPLAQATNAFAATSLRFHTQGTAAKPRERQATAAAGGVSPLTALSSRHASGTRTREEATQSTELLGDSLLMQTSVNGSNQITSTRTSLPTHPIPSSTSSPVATAHVPATASGQKRAIVIKLSQSTSSTSPAATKSPAVSITSKPSNFASRAEELFRRAREILRSLVDAKELDTAVSLLQQATEIDATHWQAKAQLARCWRDGTGVQQSHEKAVQILRELQEGGHAIGVALLSNAYMRGEGVEKNVPLAFSMLQSGPHSAAPACISTLGYWYQNHPDRKVRSAEKAVTLFRQAAETHDPFGMVALADAYVKGEGAVKSAREAATWLERVPDDSHQFVDALIMLAQLLRKGGADLPADPVRSHALMVRAAEFRNPYAMLEIINAFRDGQHGATKSLKNSVQWMDCYKRLFIDTSEELSYSVANTIKSSITALRKGDAAAQLGVDRLVILKQTQKYMELLMDYYRETANTLGELTKLHNEIAAAECQVLLHKANDGHDPESQFQVSLNIFYKRGKPGEWGDEQIRNKMLAEAAGKGHLPSRILQLLIACNGGDAAALKQLHAAASSPFTSSPYASIAECCNLLNHVATSLNLPVDAFRWLKRAADLGQASSCVGMVNAHGPGKVNEDEKRRMHYLQRAADLGDASAQQSLAIWHKKLHEHQSGPIHMRGVLRLLRLSAHQRFMPAIVSLADLYVEPEAPAITGASGSSLFSSAREWLQLGVSANDGDALTAHARLLLRKEGQLRVDRQTAFKELTAAVEQGNTMAVFYRAILFTEDDSTEWLNPDPAPQGIPILILFTSDGVPTHVRVEAATRLARCLQFGRGTTVDLKSAEEKLRFALSLTVQGSKDSFLPTVQLAELLISPGVDRPTEALTLLRSAIAASEQSSNVSSEHKIKAQVLLADLHSHGLVSAKEAFDILDSMNHMTVSDMSVRLASLSLEGGPGLKQDTGYAAYHVQMAVKLVNDKGVSMPNASLCRLAEMLLDPRVCDGMLLPHSAEEILKRSQVTAFRILQKAANLGYAPAHLQLSLMYRASKTPPLSDAEKKKLHFTVEEQVVRWARSSAMLDIRSSADVSVVSRREGTRTL